ncbi:hypothetical protein LBMAG46_09870 [Planctomycetia bacterium]|nr:hypothetical protein LBMAG46_09870 [Planctomycetia bacterium]
MRQERWQTSKDSEQHRQHSDFWVPWQAAGCHSRRRTEGQSGKPFGIPQEGAGEQQQAGRQQQDSAEAWDTWILQQGPQQPGHAEKNQASLQPVLRQQQIFQQITACDHEWQQQQND